MLDHRPLVICVTIIAASVVNSASAQYCDGPFPWQCRYDRPPPQAVRPWQPFPPREYVPEAQPVAPAAPVRPGGYARPVDPGLLRQYAALYARVDGEPFPIPAVRLSDIDPEYLRKAVMFPTSEPPGTIVIDPQNHFLYLVQGGGRAIRYGVGVGRQGFGWSGVATIHNKQEWPDWYPPKEMIAAPARAEAASEPSCKAASACRAARAIRSARAPCISGRATRTRSTASTAPSSRGPSARSVSSGCIRMINQDVIDLYQRTPLGAQGRGAFVA